LYYVSPGQINFVVPWNAPTGGTADVQVLNTVTGQLLAASKVNMNTVSPAIFVGASVGVGVRLAAVSNNATGQGLVPSPPADGDIPRNGLVAAQGSLRVIIGTDYTDQIQLQGSEQRSIPGVDTNFIQFSGLSPAFPGMWQVNVRIPLATAAGAQAVALLLNSFPDNDPSPTPPNGNGTGYRIVFYVAPL